MWTYLVTLVWVPRKLLSQQGKLFALGFLGNCFELRGSALDGDISSRSIRLGSVHIERFFEAQTDMYRISCVINLGSAARIGYDCTWFHDLASAKQQGIRKPSSIDCKRFSGLRVLGDWIFILMLIEKLPENLHQRPHFTQFWESGGQGYFSQFVVGQASSIVSDVDAFGEPDWLLQFCKYLELLLPLAS